MADPDLTHVTLVIDRSGSMQSIRDDAIGGFNAFLEQQRGQPGRVTLTLVQFDDVFEEVYRGMPVEDAPELNRETFLPRGQTALYDAIGKAIVQTLEYVRGLDEQRRPARVVVVVLTDGEENASREFSHTQVTSVIAEVMQRTGWHLLFLASELRVVREATQMGYRAENTQVFAASPRGTREAYQRMSHTIIGVRSEVGAPPPPVKDDPSDPGKKMN